MKNYGDFGASLIMRNDIIGGLQPISRDTDNNDAMYNSWWTNKRR